MTLTWNAPVTLLLLTFASFLHALPHDRHLLHISETSSSLNNVPSSSQQLTNTALFFDPSHQEKTEVTTQDEDNSLHKPQGAEDEIDDGLDAMKVLDVDLEDITGAPSVMDNPDETPMRPTPIPGAQEATLSSLVDNQVEQLVPVTKDDEQMSPVQQSLASALHHDIKSLLKTYEDTVYDTVKTLYDDYSLKGDSVATTLKPPAQAQIELSETKTKSEYHVPSDTQAKKTSPSVLKTFFAKYDFEVDAEMIQDKLFAAYNSVALDDQFPHDEDHHDKSVAGHFHPTTDPPFSTPKMENGDLCDTTHDPNELFKHIDFGTKKSQPKEQVKVEGNDEVEKEVDTDDIMLAISDDIGEEESKKNNNTETKPFVAYFTDEEKEKYDSETIEDFYDRFLSLKGTIIRPVIVS
ncbi:hypothetical protein CAPTEDRAFT_223620 [Capitella teleta]|uniref:Uncharacterized protein n=1 Tax=Capitella teleta TaxID=283909 RepID=R7UVX2_CAPTE|nr:hypothetical protein CAPTEDRAFT_223620 [Capitella teleta]|eukprot:ELU10768.1 hypothetical protein CAPTEDRAFT_223620 [Capitella teleta]